MSVETKDITDVMSDGFIEYAMAVINERALPNLKDGLKPVHRRLLYAINELGLTPGGKFLKSARIVGDVIGKYHPHGDMSVYDAMVVLAQPFSMAQPIIDGQGNFGSIDGDSAAAMRYTEATITKYGKAVIGDVTEDILQFKGNYDDSDIEPTILDCRVPNIIINGAYGIAVGYTTNILPHNLIEVLTCCQALLRDVNLTIDDMTAIIKGPDFPTGGNVFGKNSIKEMMETGIGKVTVRAKIEFDANDSIIIKELPYRVNKAALVRAISVKVADKEISGISNIIDMSDRHGLHIEIKLKRGSIREVVLNQLFQKTDLSINITSAMRVIDNGKPVLLGIKDILIKWLMFRRSVTIKKLLANVKRLEDKIEKVSALLIVSGSRDVIRIITNSKNYEEAKKNLMAKYNKLTLSQVKYILNLKLLVLTKDNRKSNEDLFKKLTSELNSINNILKDSVMIDNIIHEELEELKSLGGKRKTRIYNSAPIETVKDTIANIDEQITATNNGYVKRTPIKNITSQGRGGTGRKTQTVYDDDHIVEVMTVKTHSTLMVITNKGRCFKLSAYEIPTGGIAYKGKNIANLVNFSSGEKMSKLIFVPEKKVNLQLVIFTAYGLVKNTPLTEYSNINKGGIKAIKLQKGDSIVSAFIKKSNLRWYFVSTKLGTSIRFSAIMRTTGRDTVGVKAITLRENDSVVSGIPVYDESGDILICTETGMGKRTPVSEFTPQKRAGIGLLSYKLKSDNCVIGAAFVDKNDDSDLVMVSSMGKVIRINVSTVRTIGRITRGVRLITPKKNDKLTSFTISKRGE